MLLAFENCCTNVREPFTKTAFSIVLGDISWCSNIAVTQRAVLDAVGLALRMHYGT